MPRTAMVMVNHNGGDEVVASVESVLAALGREDAIFLIDNGSADGSGERAAKVDPARIRFHAHPENRTFAEATNIGIEKALAAGFKFIGPVNPDVRLGPLMIEKLLNSLTDLAHEQPAGVSPAMLYDGPGDRVWYAGGRILYPLSWTSHTGNHRPVSSLPKHSYRTGFFTGCCWLSPANVWREVGLLDPSYGMYAEDADWSVRALKAGYSLWIEPEAHLVHRLSHTTGGGRTPFKMYYRTLAGRLFFRRWTPRGWRLARTLLTPVFVIPYAKFLYFFSGRRAAFAYIRAWRTQLGDRVPWPPSRKMIESL